ETKVLVPAEDSGPVLSVGFTSGDERVFASDTEGRTRLWDWRTQSVVGSLERQPAPIRTAFSADGTVAVTGDEKGTVAVWGPGLQRPGWRRQTHGPVTTVSLTARWVMALTGNGDIHLWDRRSGRALRLA